jgi:hypothetical protein
VLDVGAPDKIVASVFALADTDGDGKVSIDELRALNLVYSEVENLKAELNIGGGPGPSGGKGVARMLTGSMEIRVASFVAWLQATILLLSPVH